MEKERMNNLRKKFARALFVLILPVSVYIGWNLGDPNYDPSIGWVFGSILLSGASIWSVFYGWGYPYLEYDKD